jgi:hypothetical protein
MITFNGLNSLQDLKLGNNKLKIIYPLIFNELNSLRVLFLDNINIKSQCLFSHIKYTL